MLAKRASFPSLQNSVVCTTLRKSRFFSRTKSVPAGSTPGAVQVYAWKRALRSLAAHRARRIDIYTFKSARPLWQFLAFVPPVVLRSRFFRIKSVPVGLTPGTVPSYALKRALRSFRAHRARSIDFYTFKCAPPFWRFFGVFIVFVGAGAVYRGFP